MAGTWTQTKGPKGRPGIYVQETPRGAKRYKAAYRDAHPAIHATNATELHAPGQSPVPQRPRS